MNDVIEGRGTLQPSSTARRWLFEETRRAACPPDAVEGKFTVDRRRLEAMERAHFLGGGYKVKAKAAAEIADGETHCVGSLGLYETPFAGGPSSKEGPRCFRATSFRADSSTNSVPSATSSSAAVRAYPALTLQADPDSMSHPNGSSEVLPPMAVPSA